MLVVTGICELMIDPRSCSMCCRCFPRSRCRHIRMEVPDAPLIGPWPANCTRWYSQARICPSPIPNCSYRSHRYRQRSWARVRVTGPYSPCTVFERFFLNRKHDLATLHPWPVVAAAFLRGQALDCLPAELYQTRGRTAAHVELNQWWARRKSANRSRPLRLP